MALKKGLRDLLIGDVNLSALVGNRVRVDRQFEGTDYPCIVFHVVAAEYNIQFSGVNASQMRRVQFNCQGKTPKSADDVATALHTLMDGFSGSLSDGTCVQGCFPSTDVDLTDEELQLVTIAVDCVIWFVPSNFVSTPGGNVTLPENVWDIDDIGEPQEDPPLAG